MEEESLDDVLYRWTRDEYRKWQEEIDEAIRTGSDTEREYNDLKDIIRVLFFAPSFDEDRHTNEQYIKMLKRVDRIARVMGWENSYDFQNRIALNTWDSPIILTEEEDR